MFWKWIYWTKGISTREFNKEQISDIKDVMDIANTIEQKQISQKKVQDLINNSQIGF